MNGAPDFLTTEPNLFAVFLRTGSSLLLVLALACLAVWVLKSCYRPKRKAAGALQVLSRVSLGGRRSVCLVKVAEKALVLGVSETSVTRLCVLNAADIQSDESEPTVSPSKFSEIFSEKIRGLMGPK